MKSLSKNFVTSIVGKIVLMLTSIIVQREILHNFGSDINGLTSTIAQILSYLTLLEAGLGYASLQALYEPLSKNDWKQVNGIVSATNQQYRKTGIMFLFLLTGAACIIPLIVEGDIPAIVMGTLTLLTGLNNVISYTFTGKYTTFLNSDRRLYVVNNCDMFAAILSCILRVIVIKVTHNILIAQSVHLCTVVIKLILVRTYVKKHYPQLNLSVKPDLSAISKRWNVLIHQIASMVVSHTSIIILSITQSLKIVSVYSVYNYVFSNISALLTAGFSQAPMSFFGRLYQRKDSTLENAYLVFESLFYAVLHSVLMTAIIVVLPFVQLYTNGVTDIQYIDSVLAILFLIVTYLNLIRIPSVVMINVAGMFAETQRGAIYEAVINLVASLILLQFFGVYGLLLGGCVSYIYRTTDVIVFSYRNILKNGLFKNFIRIGLNIVVCIIEMAAGYGKISIANITWGRWIVVSMIVLTINAVVFIILNVLLNSREAKVFIEKYCRKPKRGN